MKTCKNSFKSEFKVFIFFLKYTGTIRVIKIRVRLTIDIVLQWQGIRQLFALHLCSYGGISQTCPQSRMSWIQTIKLHLQIFQEPIGLDI